MQVKNAYLPQYLGQYSGPWHLAQAIRSSPYVTTDLDAADIVYVYDYCYYTWWLSFVHSNGRVQREDATPGDHLLKGYQVCQMPGAASWSTCSIKRLSCCTRYSKLFGSTRGILLLSFSPPYV